MSMAVGTQPLEAPKGVARGPRAAQRRTQLTHAEEREGLTEREKEREREREIYREAESERG